MPAIFRASVGACRPARVDDQPAAQLHRLGAADLELDAAASATRRLRHRAVEGEHRAVALGVALQGQHVGVAVDDAGGGREQRRRAVQVGLHRDRLGGAQEAHALDAIGLGAALDLGQLLALGLVGGDDQLAAIAVRHAVLGAVGIEQAPAGDAGARHQAALGIVDAGVDDLGIARAGLGADAFGGLDDDDLTAGKGKGAGDGEADDAGADHNAVDGFERGRIHGRMLVDGRDYASKTSSCAGGASLQWRDPCSLSEPRMESRAPSDEGRAGHGAGRADRPRLGDGAGGRRLLRLRPLQSLAPRPRARPWRISSPRAARPRRCGPISLRRRQAEALVGKCRRRACSSTCLVNNASLFKLDRAPTATADDFDRHMAINLRAPLLIVAGPGAAAARRARPA